jgi:ribonucleoside-diphosphate reductase alpha chain
MSVKALQDYTFVSKYARYNPDLKRRETWGEAVERVRDMHLRKFPQIENELRWSFEQVKNKRVLGSQRALQFGGKPVESKNARMYNCIASYCDRLRFFQECFWLLLCGCGTGFSVQKHHVAKLPDFLPEWTDAIESIETLKERDQHIWGKMDPVDAAKQYVNRPQKVFVIPDTIEGWADALGVLISSFFGGGDFPEYAGYDVVFDYSLIRSEGAPLASSAGKAPGPKPLERALERIRQLLRRCIYAGGQKRLRPIDAYDIVMYASDAVLSGGVRRSATICLFSPDDMEMAMAKIGNWLSENPQRGRSNNSALLVRNKTTKEQFEKLMQFVREFGEPGFVWADSTELVVNPCVEIGMYPVDVTTGLTGWQACNLCEINGKRCKTKKDFRIASKAAAIIGTAQAGYTSFGYLGETSKRIIEREALLGVSITGMMDNPDVLLNPKLQREMARLILKINEEVAKKIGINPCARATCVKPAGTTSCILGTASGIHPHHAKRYIRRSQANYMEAPLQHFKKINPIAVEKSVWSENGSDEVLAFCIEVPKGAKLKNEIDAVTLLRYVKLTQENWVMAGTRKESCTQDWLVHNVSNTITVRDNEWGPVTDFIYENRQFFAGISLLPITGDKDFPQAPFTSIHTPMEIAKMYGDGSLMASGLIVDGLHAFADLWVACDAALGRGEPLVEPKEPIGEPQTEDGFPTVSISEFTAWQKAKESHEKKVDWVRRAHQFARRYFGGDTRLMTYCLKDVNNWKYWCDLNREYKPVDYVTMIEKEDNTKQTQEWACSGGACEVSYTPKASKVG